MAGHLIERGWKAYLDRDERLLWEGRPNTGLRFSPRGLKQSAFGILFLGFAVFWTYNAFQSGSEGTTDSAIRTVFPLFGVPFVVAGAYLVFGHWFFDAFKRSRSRYALSNKRAFVATEILQRRLRSYPINEHTVIEYAAGPEATIYFAEDVRSGENGETRTPIGFEYISDGEKVYRLIRKVMEREL